jgi:hypothetical protein
VLELTELLLHRACFGLLPASGREQARTGDCLRLVGALGG